MQTDVFRYRFAGLVALVALLPSCGGPESSSTSGPGGGPVPTSRITMNLTVESSEPGLTVVRANLNDGQLLGESYRLDGGDFLRACVNGACRDMVDNNSILTPDYIARFDYQSGIDHVVSFSRQQGGNAPDSRAALPPAFTLVTPANHQQVTTGETVMVSWSPTGAPARVSLSYSVDCTFPSGQHGYASGTRGADENADGQESVAIDPMVTFDRTTWPLPPTRCSIDVTIGHELPGRIDPAFRRGIALGIVSRKVNLDYIPR